MPGVEPSELRSLPLFRSLSEAELAEIAPWFEVKEVDVGVRLVGEGATGHSFFVIGEGEASVTTQGEEIATLRAGDFFGEVALLAWGRRTATVTTTSPARLFVLFGPDFARLTSQFPGLAEVLMHERDRHAPLADGGGDALHRP